MRIAAHTFCLAAWPVRPLATMSRCRTGGAPDCTSAGNSFKIVKSRLIIVRATSGRARANLPNVSSNLDTCALLSGALKSIATSWPRSASNVLAKPINDGPSVGRATMMASKNDVAPSRAAHFVSSELFAKGPPGCVHEITISVFCDA